jgi:predicted dehydrogenase
MKSLGIIGCGAVTQNQYVKVLGMFHDVSVNAVFDINTELANLVARQLSAKVVTKQELLEKSDIIIICTPPSTHFGLVQEALAPGKKVICEKPFVGTVKECIALSDLALKRDAELYVAHFRRNFPSVQLAHSIIKSKVLGDVKAIEVYEGGKFSWVTTSGYVYKDPFGGVLFDTGSHTIDMALFMANLDTVNLIPQVVSIVKDKPEPAHDITANLKLNMADSVIDLKIKLSRKLLLSNKIRIICSNGYIDIPAGVAADHIRISGQSGSTVVYSAIKYDDLMEPFAMQFKDMFYDVKDSVYASSRFVNLTKILETIANN